MSSYERSGKPSLPRWWTDLVFPLLDSDVNDHGEIARKASEFAGRKSAWKRDAISKFKSGIAQTRELANGISFALGVPQPYFEARSPEEAIAIAAMMRANDAALGSASPDQYVKLRTADDMAERERRAAIDQTVHVVSDNEGSIRGGRSRRTTRGGA